MDTAANKVRGAESSQQAFLWLAAERQLEEVLKAVRLMDSDIEAVAAPLLHSLHTLVLQNQGNECGQTAKIGRLLTRALGTMLYAPDLAQEVGRLACELLEHNERAEEPEDLLPLQAALLVKQFQNNAQQKNHDEALIATLQTVTTALDVAAESSESGGTFILLLSGCLHYVSGHLDHMLTLYERHGYRISQDFPLWYDLFCMQASIAALYCDRFPLSIGIIESCRNTAEITGSSRQSLYWRMHLSFILLHMDHLQEALPHIDHVLTVAAAANIQRMNSVVNRALAFYHYKNGNAEAAARLLVADGERLHTGKHAGILVTDPAVLEMLFDLQIRQGFSIPKYEIERELQRFDRGPNSFLRGVGLCLRGRLALERLDKAGAVELLRKGFQELLHSGSLSGCLRAGSELEHLLGELGEHDERLRLQERLSRIREALPAQVVNDEADISTTTATLRRALSALEEVPLGGTGAENLARLTGILRRELSAQRVVLVRSTPCGDFEYATGSNFTQVEARSAHFRITLQPLQELCRQATPERPVLLRRHKLGIHRALGLAIFVSGSVPWILYMDNSLGTGDFTDLSQDAASMFCAALAAEIRGILRGDTPQIRRGTVPDSSAQGDRVDSPMPPLFGEGMRAVLDDAERAAETSVSVLILGETGVGKEILARYIHERSGCIGPFVPVHLACISEHLFESELFGHEKGAFTGAVRVKTGLVELARNGVLFLDEVGDIPLPFQVKLLRFLQERAFMRVGGVQTLRSHFRLVTATNRDLRHEVRQGRFREDLYHRLAVIPLQIPPLRERRSDILPLALAFRRHYAEMHGRSGLVPTDAQLAMFTDRQWPGNIRELQGAVERAVVLGRWHEEGQPVLLSDEKTPPAPDASPASVSLPVSLSGTGTMNTFPTAEAVLQTYIRQVLDKTGGKIYGADGAAAILGMTKSTLYARMKKMGL